MYYFIFIVITISTLLIVLTIHELGHFTFAKIFNVNIKEFSIGVGPAIFTYLEPKKNIKYSFRCIPIMAYVMIDSQALRKVYIGEEDDKNYKFIMQKPVGSLVLLEEAKHWQYYLIMFGGILANLIFFSIFALIYNFVFESFTNLASSSIIETFQSIVNFALFNIKPGGWVVGGDGWAGNIFHVDPSFATNGKGAINSDINWGRAFVANLLILNLITAIINIFPLPPLDGSKVFMHGYEQISHKKVPEKVESTLTWTGVTLLGYITLSSLICTVIVLV